MNTKTLVIMALFTALSFVGSNVKIFGSIAFDSLPGFVAALLLGPVQGAAIGFLGHLFTALTSGFPLSIPMHFVIAVSMAITMLGFGFTYNALKNRASERVSFAITGIVGTIFNGPISLAISISALAFLAGMEAAWGLLALLPVLTTAAIVNIVIAIALFKTLERVWNRGR